MGTAASTGTRRAGGTLAPYVEIGLHFASGESETPPFQLMPVFDKAGVPRPHPAAANQPKL